MRFWELFRKPDARRAASMVSAYETEAAPAPSAPAEDEGGLSATSSALAFYGCTLDSSALGEVLAELETWSASLGWPLSKLALSRNGRHRWGDFQRVAANARKRGFDDVDSMSMSATLAYAEYPMLDHAVHANANREDASISIEARCSLAPLPGQAMLSLAEAVVRIARPAYGIGFTMPHARGPAFYAVGMNFGPRTPEISDVEAMKVSFWGAARHDRLWEQGLLRDVYRWNFLTEAQLRKRVVDRPLQAWIEARRHRGSLRRIGPGTVLWEVDRDDLLKVRRALWDAGVLFNWPKHVPGAEKHPDASEIRGPTLSDQVC